MIGEIVINTLHANCLIDSECKFHINVRGVDALNDKRPIFFCADKVVVPKIKKKIEVLMYFGKKRHDLVTASDMSEMVIEYFCLNDLLVKINYFMMCSEVLDTCKNVASGHKDHVCDSFDTSTKYFRIENNLISLYLPENYILVLTANVAGILGFENEVFLAYSAEEKSNMTSKEMLESKSKYVKFDSRWILASRSTMFLNTKENFIHFIFPDFSCKTLKDGNFYSVAFTYDVVKGLLCDNSYKRVKNLRNMTFMIVNNDFKPFDFGCDLKSEMISFSLILYCPI